MATFVKFLQEQYGLRKVRITGGEPLIRPEIESLVEVLCELGVPDIALTTNGQNLAKRAKSLRKAGLHRLNVSLDSLEESTFQRLSGLGSLGKTLEGLEAAQAAGFAPMKLNTVVMRGINDHEPPHLLDFALEHGFEPRFLEVMPIGSMQDSFDQYFVPSKETLERLPERFEIRTLSSPRTGTARLFSAKSRPGHRGVFGFISAISEPFCDGCRRLRLTSSGDLIGCLGKESRFPVRSLLEAPQDRPAELKRIVDQALASKRTFEAFRGEAAMAPIGG